MPEKKLKEIPRPLRDLYDKGKQALQRDNLDYAIDIFSDVLSKEAAFFECREALRVAQTKKHGGKKKLFGGFGGANPKLAKAKVITKSKPAEAMVICEQVLSGDPNNATAHRMLAEAALALELPRTAVWSLEFARRTAPKDKDVSVALAEAYAANGQVDEAELVYADLLRANPNDGAITRAYRNLSARKTMDKGGYDGLADGKGSFRDIIKDKDEAAKLEQEQRAYKDPETLAKLLEEAYEQLSQDPTPQQARKVADLYFELKDYPSALKYYKQILELPGAADPELEKLVTICTLKDFDRRMRDLDPEAPEYTDRVQDLEKERALFMLDDCKRRADKYPNDLGIRFELGTLFFKAGKTNDAIKEFQKSQKDSKRRIQSMYHLAQCFAKRKMYDMAARTIESAIKEKSMMDDEKKDLIYTYGTILEAMDKGDAAVEQFKQIYEIDIGYRDVSDKIENYYSDGDEEG